MGEENAGTTRLPEAQGGVNALLSALGAPVGRKSPREQVSEGGVLRKHLSEACGVLLRQPAGLGHSVTSTDHLLYAKVCVRPVGHVRGGQRKEPT